MFSQYYHQAASPRLIELANIAQSRYDLVFLCDIDIPYDDTWDRSGYVNREILQKQIYVDLIVRKIPFFDLSGNLSMRVTQIGNIFK